MKTELEIPAKEWNAEKGKMEDTSLPEWQKYYADLQRHEKFCDDYKYFLDRIVQNLDWLSTRRVNPSNTWTPPEIKQVISDEIDRKRSMDAPNKPGYFRANND